MKLLSKLTYQWCFRKRSKTEAVAKVKQNAETDVKSRLCVSCINAETQKETYDES